MNTMFVNSEKAQPMTFGEIKLGEFFLYCSDLFFKIAFDSTLSGVLVDGKELDKRLQGNSFRFFCNDKCCLVEVEIKQTGESNAK